MLDFAARNNMALKNIPGYEEIIADIQGRPVVDAETEARVDEARANCRGKGRTRDSRNTCRRSRYRSCAYIEDEAKRKHKKAQSPPPVAFEN